MEIVEKFETDVKYGFDVLVVGGDVAGTSAALSAARNGAKVGLEEMQYMRWAVSGYSRTRDDLSAILRRKGASDKLRYS